MNDGEIHDEEAAGLDAQIKAPDPVSAGLFKVDRQPARIGPAELSRFEKAVSEMQSGREIVLHNVAGRFSTKYPAIERGGKRYPMVVLRGRLWPKTRAEEGSSAEYHRLSPIECERLLLDESFLADLRSGWYRIHHGALPGGVLTPLQRATQENAELKARIRELEAAAPIDAKAPEK